MTDFSARVKITLFGYAMFDELNTFLNPISLDNKGSWRILNDFYCSVTMLRELGLIYDGLKSHLQRRLLLPRDIMTDV